jgi:glucose/mannose transport system substrate-binding protein
MKRNLMCWTAAMVLTLGAASATAEELELMHFWTSGGEAAAMNVIKKAAQGADIQWKDALWRVAPA